MKKILLLFVIALSFGAIQAQEAEQPAFHIAGKVYPSLYDGNLRGFNTGAEVGYGRYALGLNVSRIFEAENSVGFNRFEVQPRVYGCSCGDGMFAAFSYMLYNNGENSYGGMLGYKFNVVEIMSIELFGGLQSNTSYETDWSEIKYRSRFGVGLVFGI